MRKTAKRCRLVRGKKETCCINPKRGYWCWTTKTKRRKCVKMMIRACCRK